MAKDKGLPVCIPELVLDSAQGMQITKLYNPLLLAGKTNPIPCDLATKRRDAVVMVTGPNSGGKTRLFARAKVRAQRFQVIARRRERLLRCRARRKLLRERLLHRRPVDGRALAR